MVVLQGIGFAGADVGSCVQSYLQRRCVGYRYVLRLCAASPVHSVHPPMLKRVGSCAHRLLW